MRRARIPHLVLFAGTLALCFGVSPAAAHKHPGAPVVAGPAVVYVQTSVLAKVSVVERSAGSTVTTPYQRAFPLGRGSGFVVNPDGTVVTVSSVVGHGLGGADVDAAAEEFQKEYGELGIPTRFVQTGFKGALATPINLRRGCFERDATHSACVEFASPVFRVFPYVQDTTSEGLKARVLHTGDAGGDVAVLKVESRQGMPTVNLASSSASTPPFTVLGFTKPPSGNDQPTSVVGHFKNAPGARTIDADPKQTNVGDLLAKLGGGLAGGPLVTDEGRVIGLASRAGDKVEMKFVEAVRGQLTAAGVQATQGPVDAAFAEAKGYFDARHYTPAVTRLQDVLRMYPQHALAKQLLSTSVAKAGGPEDLHPQQTQVATSGGSERGPLFWGSVATGVLLLAGGALAVVFRSRLHRPAPQRAPVPSGAGRPAAAAPRGPARVGATPVGSDGPQAGTRWQEPQTDGLVSGHAGGSRAQMQVRAAKDLTGSRPTFCTQCGKPLAVGHRFCGFCGTRVTS